jgi:hypothetical protein
MEHTLKTYIEYFEHLRNGSKMFEVRKNDRNFRVGDTLVLKEYNPEKMPHYTGRSCIRIVTYIIQGVFGLPDDMCVMGVR